MMEAEGSGDPPDNDVRARLLRSSRRVMVSILSHADGHPCWGDLDDNERQMVRGDAVKVAQLVPGLAPFSIERYFTTWDLEEDPPRMAYVDDEFHYGEDWQLVDFLKRLGFQYPLDSVGHPLGQTFRLSVNQ